MSSSAKLARFFLLLAVMAPGGGRAQVNPISDVFTSPEGTLSHGSGNADYDSDLVLSWIIAPPDRGPLAITFTEFDVEEGHDFVTVWSCDTPACEQPELIELIEAVGTVRVPTGIAKVDFSSDESVQQGGFTAAWVAACLGRTYSSSGTSDCTTCSANTTSDAGSSAIANCTCMVGYTGLPGGPCEACEPGTHKPWPGSYACVACPPGYFAAAAGAGTCMECAAGSYQPAWGATACVACPANASESPPASQDQTACTCTTGCISPGGVCCPILRANQGSFAGRVTNNSGCDVLHLIPPNASSIWLFFTSLHTDPGSSPLIVQSCEDIRCESTTTLLANLSNTAGMFLHAQGKAVRLVFLEADSESHFEGTIGLLWTSLSWAMEAPTRVLVLSPSDAWGTNISEAGDGTAILLLPGRYTGYCGIHVNQSIIMASVGEFSDIELDCEDRGQLMVITGATVVLHGITVQRGYAASNGGCLSIRDKARVSIFRSKFHDCAAWGCGGAISSDQSTVQLSEGVEITECSAQTGGGVCVRGGGFEASRNVVLQDNDAASKGGGVYASSSNLEMSASVKIVGNAAAQGGGVYAENSDGIAISNGVEIVGNTAGFEGGGIYAYYSDDMTVSGGVEFVGNAARRGGGGIYADHSHGITISGSVEFVGNTAGSFGRPTRGGGGIFAWRSNDMAILDGVEIVGNTAEERGGGVFAYRSNSMVISGSVEIVGNTAGGDGGGLYAFTSRNVVISDNVQIIGNYVDADGGGLHATDSDDMVISDGVAIGGNTAVGEGGGIYAYFSDDMTISGGVEIVGNTADEDGGGAKVYGSDDVVISDGVKFVDNAAWRGFGGGIHASYCSRMAISNDVKIVGNAACLEFVPPISGGEWGGGGGIYAFYSDDMTISGGVEILNNTAWRGPGGGIHASDSSRMTISNDVKIVGNTVTQRHAGGGIYAYYSDGMTISGGVEIVGNTADEDGGGAKVYGSDDVVISDGVKFLDNSAQNSGGGLYTNNCPNMVISGGVKIVGNTASFGGGGIYVERSPDMTISGGVEFVDNAAWQGSGGGIHASLCRGMAISNDVKFIGHTAGVSGGGIFARACVSHLAISDGVKIVNNTADRGGGLYTSDCPATVISDGVEFLGNAAQSGGCIFAGVTSLRLSGGILVRDCSATLGAGISVVARSQLSVEQNSSFVGNHAEDQGGSIWVDASQVQLSDGVEIRDGRAVLGAGVYLFDKSSLLVERNVTFAGNRAHGQGGSIYATGSSHVLLSDRVQMREGFAVAGAGVYVSDSDLVADQDVSFVDLSARMGGGIAVVGEASRLGLSGVHFRNTSANSVGGAIYFETLLATRVNSRDLPRYTISNCSFVSSSAKDGGGAVASVSAVELRINSSAFSDCKAGISGGSIMVSSQAFVSVRSSTFEQGSAGTRGGAISADGCMVELVDSAFLNCSSGETGGAVYHIAAPATSTSESPESLSVHSCTFSSCSSSAGGAIGKKGSTMQVSNSSFFANMAAGEGGAIHAASVQIELVGSDLTDNSAHGGGGGALFADTCTSRLHNVMGGGNSAPRGGGGVLFWRGGVEPVLTRQSGRRGICGSAGQGHETVVGAAAGQPSAGANRAEQVPSVDNASSENAAAYGACLATAFDSFQTTGPATVFPGQAFDVVLEKRDFYGQVIASDSSSFLQVFSALPNSTQIDPSLLLVGSLAVVLDKGIASFSIAVHPTYTHWNQLAGTTTVINPPSIRFEGLDSENGRCDDVGLIQTDVITIDLHRDVCKPGESLELTSTDLGYQGACKRCLTGTYSLDPLAGSQTSQSTLPSCLRCPAGGRCPGGAVVDFELGAWAARNGSYFLVSCPVGHYVVNQDDKGFNAEVQRFLQCPAGQECVSPPCVTCTLCAAGKYKSFVGVEACEVCPANTFRVERGTTELRACDSCPEHSSTRGQTGQSSPEACLCDAGFYLVSSECVVCPRGAVCEGESLVTRDGLDATGEVVWARDDDNRWKLLRCPRGYRLERSRHDEQECVACGPGAFIMKSDDPALQCQKCPDGLICLGGGPPVSSPPVSGQLALAGLVGSDIASVEALKTMVQGAIRAAIGGGDAVVSVELPCQELAECRALLGSRRSAGFVLAVQMVASNNASVSLGELDEFVASPAFSDALAEQFLARGQGFTPSFELVDASGQASSVGKYEFENGALKLVSCPAGFLLVNSSLESQKCKRCDALTYSLSPLDGCTQGPDGETICADRVCQSCAVGAFCPGGSSFLPIINGSVWEVEAADGVERFRLAECPPGYLLVRDDIQAANDQCFQCPMGTYSLQRAVHPHTMTAAAATGALDLCIDCVDDAECSEGDRVRADEGFWRGTDEDHQARVYRCTPGLCLGGGADPGEQVCRDGHQGPACAICVEGFGMQGTECVLCEEDTGENKLFNFLYLPLLGLLLLVLYYLSALRPLFAANSGLDTKVWGWCLESCTAPLVEFYGDISDNLSDAADAAKIVVSFAQVFSSLLSNLQVDWPPSIIAVMQWCSFLQFDFGRFPGVGCLLRDASYFDKLKGQTLFPVVTVALLGLPSFYVMGSGLVFHGGVFRHPKCDAVTNRWIQSILLLAFLIYPSISNMTMQAFRCNDYGADGNLLDADHRISCNSDEYLGVMIWAGVCVLIYPIGIPALMFVLMLKDGVGSKAAEKAVEARFQAMLVLWQRQTATLISTALTVSVGSREDQEFKHRILDMYVMGMEVEGDPAIPNSLCPRRLRRAIAGIAEVPETHIPPEQVEALFKEYAGDGKGISIRRLRQMVHDVVTGQTVFSGQESFLELTMPQLLFLHQHPWDRPNPRHMAHSGEEELAYNFEWYQSEQRMAALARREREGGAGNSARPRRKSSIRAMLLPQLADSIAPGATKLEGLRAQKNSQLADLSEVELVNGVQSIEGLPERQLRKAIMAKAMELETKGRIPVQGTVWSEDGDEVEKRAIARLGFIFLSYRCDLWWFEMVLMLYKLLMSSAVIFFFEGTPSQVAVAFLITFFILILNIIKRPFISHELYVMQIYALTVQTFNLFYGVMIISGSFGESIGGNGQDPYVEGVMTGLICMVFLLPFILILDIVRRKMGDLTKAGRALKAAAHSHDASTSPTSRQSNHRGEANAVADLPEMCFQKRTLAPRPITTSLEPPSIRATSCMREVPLPPPQSTLPESQSPAGSPASSVTGSLPASSVTGSLPASSVTGSLGRPSAAGLEDWLHLENTP